MQVSGLILKRGTVYQFEVFGKKFIEPYFGEHEHEHNEVYLGKWIVNICKIENINKMASRPIKPQDLRPGDLVKNLAITGYVTDHPQKLIGSDEYKFHLADRWEKGFRGVPVWVSSTRELELLERIEDWRNF